MSPPAVTNGRMLYTAGKWCRSAVPTITGGGAEVVTVGGSARPPFGTLAKTSIARSILTIFTTRVGCQHDHGIHLHAANAVFDGVGMIIAVAVRHRQPIVEERHVEFAGFENSRDLLGPSRREPTHPRSCIRPQASAICPRSRPRSRCRSCDVPAPADIRSRPDRTRRASLRTAASI